MLFSPNILRSLKLMLKGELSSPNFSLCHFSFFLVWFTFLDMPFFGIIPRSSHRRCFIKKRFPNFLEKDLCWSLFLINFIRKGLQHRSFPGKPVNNYFCISFLEWVHENIFLWLLLLFKAIFQILYLQRNLTEIWCFTVVTLVTLEFK